jgi:hypothetical protein
MSAPDDSSASPAEASAPVEPPEADDFDESGPDSDNLRDLLRRTAAAPVPPPKVDLLRGVQGKLRTRSEGKFYATSWATREDNPRSTYLITAAVMLLLLVIVYWALVPGDIGLVPLASPRGPLAQRYSSSSSL